MFVIREVGSVQRSVWGSDDFDPLRSSSREFRDNRAESFEIFDSVDADLASSSIGIDSCVSIENVILAAAPVACVCLMCVRASSACASLSLLVAVFTISARCLTTTYDNLSPRPEDII